MGLSCLRCLASTVHSLSSVAAFEVMFQHLWGLLTPILWAGAFLCSAWLLGQCLTYLAGWHDDKQLVTHLLAIAVGFGGISYAGFGLGLLGKLTSFSAGLVLLFAGVLGGTTLWWWHSKPQWPRKGRSIGRFTLWMIVFLVSLAILNLISALAPPTDGDALRHHLAAPKNYAQLGGFPFIPILWWNAPGAQHVLHTMMLLLANDVAVQVLNWMLGVLLVLAVYFAGSRFFSHRVGLLGAGIFYSLTLVTTLSSSSNVEFSVAFYSLLSIIALINARKELKLRWVLLAGILGGLAGATKIWGMLGLPAALVALVVLHGRQTRVRWRKLLASGLVYGLAFGTILSPWLIRNFIASGDPLWPFLFSIFENDYWQAWQIEKFSNWSRGPGSTFWQYFTGPWHLTNNIAAYSPGVGPLSPLLLPPVILAFAPGAWIFRQRFSREERKVAAIIAAYAVTVYSIWFLGGYHHPRYIQAIYPFLSILSAAGIWMMWEEGKDLHWVRKLLVVLVTGSLGAMLMVNFAFNARALPFAFGLQSREQYLNGNVSSYRDLQWANLNLPSDSKVLFLSLDSFYYLDRPLILGVPAYQGILQYSRYIAPEELLKKLKDLGITHIYFNGLGYGNAKDLDDAWEKRPPHYGSEIEYQEWRPVELLAPLSEAGILSLIYRQTSSVTRSRTFGTKQATYVSIYEVRYDP